MAMYFTDGTIRNMRKPYKPTTIAGIGHQRGIRLRLSTSGLKTWRFYFTFKGKKYDFTIGHYPTYSIAEVEDMVKQYRIQIQEGTNPKYHRFRPKSALPLGTCNDLFTAYNLMLENKQAKSIKDVKSTIKNNTGGIKNILVKDIDRSHIDDILETIINRGSKHAAKKFKTIMHAAFELAIHYQDFIPDKKVGIKPEVDFYITTNVVKDISDKYKPKVAAKKQRFLTFDEIGELVRSPHIPPDHILRLKLLFSFGQRINQIIEAPISEINLKEKTWYWEENRMKMDKDHLLPLTDLHISLIKECYALCGSKGNWLFPKFNKPSLDLPSSAKALAGHVRMHCEETKIERFVIRDIRRTVKTLSIELGIQKDIIDRIQHHILQDTSEKTYNCHNYMDEKREALNIWCDKLETVFT